MCFICWIGLKTLKFGIVDRKLVKGYACQHYCKIQDREHSQKINIKIRHNINVVLLVNSSENSAVSRYTPLLGC